MSRRSVDEGAPQARLIDGARSGPLEDSGGLPGYEDIMDALADPSHPDHGSIKPFDPSFLDIADVNGTLARLL